RISDLAVNIAERALVVTPRVRVDMPFDLSDLAGRAQTMLAQSLDALINLNPELARKVWMSDDVIDEINRKTYENVKAGIARHPELIDDLLSMLSVSRNLERIADHAANIAKDVIYLVEGEIVRHRRKELAAKTGM
ncbi:MAG: PhoU domain-containing protein, partial [Lentisphaerota bacterium]